MIVFDLYDACPMLILVLSHHRGSATVRHASVHICVHNHHLYKSVMKSLLYVQAFKTWYVFPLLQTNQAGWLFIAHAFKPWLSVIHKGFAARIFG